MSDNTAAKHDFTKGSTAASIVRLSLPMILAQLVNVLYNIVDRMYLGRMPGTAVWLLPAWAWHFPSSPLSTPLPISAEAAALPYAPLKGEGEMKKRPSRSWAIP